VTWADSDDDLAIALACARRGTEAKACFGSLPAGAGEVPMGATGVLAARGIVRVMDGAFEAAVTDLLVVAGRLEAGCAVRLGGLQTLAPTHDQVTPVPELAAGPTGERSRIPPTRTAYLPSTRG